MNSLCRILITLKDSVISIFQIFQNEHPGGPGEGPGNPGPDPETTISPTEPTSLPTETTSLPTEPTSSATEPPTPTPTEPEPEPDEPFSCPFDGIHPHPRECNEYYICANNDPHLMRCSPGLYFNVLILQCDFSENVVCDLDNFII